MVPPARRSPLPADGPRTLRGLLRALRDGVCLTDAAGRITDVNDRLCELTGYEAGALIGCRPPYPFWPEEPESRVAIDFRTAVDGGEYVLRCRNGDRLHASITASPLDEEDPAAGLVGVVHEVTREVREREQLAEAHRVARLVSMEYDVATGIVELSRDLSEIAGLDLPADATLGALLAFVPPGHRGPLETILAEIVDGRRTEGSREIQIPVPGLEWVEIRMRGVRGRAGAVTRVRGTAQDVTPRKHAELALADSEERLRQAQRVARLGSFEVDYRSGEVRWSPGLYELFGMDPATPVVALEAARAAMPAEEAGAVRELALLTLEDGVARSMVHSYARGGERRYAELRVEALGDGPDRHRLRGTIQDITDRERAAREIHLQGHLLDAVHIAVIAFDLDGAVTHWNRGAELLSGRTAREAIGRPVTEVSVAPEHEGDVADILAEVAEVGHWEGEFRLVRKDGSTFPAFVRDALFRDLEGRPAGIAAVAVDITDRVEAERRLRAAHDYQRAITDNIGDGLCVVDDCGRLLTSTARARSCSAGARRSCSARSCTTSRTSAGPTARRCRATSARCAPPAPRARSGTSTTRCSCAATGPTCR